MSPLHGLWADLCRIGWKVSDEINHGFGFISISS